MLKVRQAYNKPYKTNHLDKSIEHRRTQNIQTYFTRPGNRIPKTQNGFDEKPGDLVFGEVAAGHIGTVIDQKGSGITHSEKESTE